MKKNFEVQVLSGLLGLPFVRGTKSTRPERLGRFKDGHNVQPGGQRELKGD